MGKENFRKCLEAHLSKKSGQPFGGEFSEESGVAFNCENYFQSDSYTSKCQLTNYADSNQNPFFNENEAKNICKFREAGRQAKCSCQGVIRVLDRPFEKYSDLLDRLREAKIIGQKSHKNL